MLAKVLLTRKQAQAIEKLKKIKNPMDTIIRREESQASSYPNLYEVSYDDIAKALYIGYQVKPDPLTLRPGERLYAYGKTFELRVRSN